MPLAYLGLQLLPVARDLLPQKDCRELADLGIRVAIEPGQELWNDLRLLGYPVKAFLGHPADLDMACKREGWAVSAADAHKSNARSPLRNPTIVAPFCIQVSINFSYRTIESAVGALFARDCRTTKDPPPHLVVRREASDQQLI